jgi:hypothetical protein
MRMLLPDLKPAGHAFHRSSCSSRLVYTTLMKRDSHGNGLPLA